MIETFFSGKSLEIISNWHAAYQSFVGANIVIFSVFSYTKNENWGSDVAHTSVFEWCYEYLMETRAHSIDIIPMNLGRIFLAIWAAQHIECDKNVILSGQKKWILTAAELYIDIFSASDAQISSSPNDDNIGIRYKVSAFFSFPSKIIEKWV